jgi:hypothetical protein
MKKKIVYPLGHSKHKGINGNTPIDFFGGSFYTSSDVKKLINGKAKPAPHWSELK